MITNERISLMHYVLLISRLYSPHYYSMALGAPRKANWNHLVCQDKKIYNSKKRKFKNTYNFTNNEKIEQKTKTKQKHSSRFGVSYEILCITESSSTKINTEIWHGFTCNYIQSTLPKSNLHKSNNCQSVGLFKSSSLNILLFLTPHKSNLLKVKAISSVPTDST